MQLLASKAQPEGRVATLDELFEAGRQLGRVRISTLSDGTYHASIAFNTPRHVEIEAKSRFDHGTPHEALCLAVLEARRLATLMS